GISLIDVLKPQNIQLSDLIIKKPFLKIYKKDSAQKKAPNYIKNRINISKVNILGGKYITYSKSLDTILSLEDYDLNIEEFLLDSTTIKSKIPFTYKDQTIAIKNLFTPINEFENLAVSYIDINPKTIIANNVNIIPSYNKEELQTKIQHEKDWIKLNIRKLAVDNYTLTDSIKYINNIQLDSSS